MALMSKLTASYMAGFIDGEWYISLIPFKNKDYPWRPYYTATIKIASTNKEIIDWIKDSFGWRIYERTYKNNPIYKNAFCWQYQSRNIKPILESIYPYLKIKRKQCELVLEKIKMQEKCAWLPFTQENADRTIAIYNELRILNKRGNVNIGSVND